MPAALPPARWIYWRCPQCGTSLVGNEAQRGEKFTCGSCQAETTVGGVAKKPKTVVQLPPGTEAALAAAKAGIPVDPAAGLQRPAAADGIRDDPESAARKAAALAQAEALRPGAAGAKALAAAPPTLKSGSRTQRPRRAGGRNKPSGSLAGVLLFTAASGLIAGGLVAWYFLAGHPDAPSQPPSAPVEAIKPRDASVGDGNSGPAAGGRPVANPAGPAPGATHEVLAAATPIPVVLSPEEVYAAAEKSVVLISRFEGGRSQSSGFGSGFFLEGGTLIVTNAHVIENAAELEIKTRDGSSGRVTQCIAFDRRRDIALLPVPETLRGRKGLKLAAALPRVGESVFAIGAPQGLDYTLTSGLVSQIRKDVPGYHTLIQTDASLSPGSSGGPLLDKHAEVIGITTLASRAESNANNLNFAVGALEIHAVREAGGEKRDLPLR